MSIKTLSELLGISYPENSNFKNEGILLLMEYITIFDASILSMLILYYYNEFVKIKIKYLRSYTEEEFSVLDLSDITRVSSSEQNAIDNFKKVGKEKYSELYEQIISFMDNKKPFQQSNFNKRMMAEALETNETYISRALSTCDKNFNALVNEYRINQVKAAFTKKDHERFTIEHIYTKAGFSQQSTFNRVFKEFSGLTPSEYIETII